MTKSQVQERLAVVQATLRDYEAKYKTAVGVTDLNMYERGISGLHVEHRELRGQLQKLADDELAAG